MAFLREIFGPSKEEIWRQLAEQIQADFVNGGLWKADKVEARHRQWTIVLDTYTVSSGKSSTTYTRMRVPYVNRDGFRFVIYRKSIFSNLGKWFGMQDVEVGYPEFDHDFIIQGNDETKLIAFFANSTIRQLIQEQPDIHLAIKDSEGFWGPVYPPDTDLLYFQVGGVIKDVEMLKSLYLLFAEVLNHLCHIGSAYENDPGIQL